MNAYETNSPLDGLFRQALEGHEPHVPADVWETLEHALGANDRLDAAFRAALVRLEAEPPANLLAEASHALDAALFECQFAQLLANHTVEAPPAVWENVAAELEAQPLYHQFASHLFDIEPAPPEKAWPALDAHLQPNAKHGPARLLRLHTGRAAQPPAAAENIRANLRPLWQRLAAAAVVLASAGALGVWIFNNLYSVDNDAWVANRRAGDATLGKAPLVSPPEEPMPWAISKQLGKNSPTKGNNPQTLAAAATNPQPGRQRQNPGPQPLQAIEHGMAQSQQAVDAGQLLETLDPSLAFSPSALESPADIDTEFGGQATEHAAATTPFLERLQIRPRAVAVQTNRYGGRQYWRVSFRSLGLELTASRTIAAK